MQGSNTASLGTFANSSCSTPTYRACRSRSDTSRDRRTWSRRQFSDDVRPDGAQDAIKGFWERFLEQFAELINGRRAFEPSPLDQRFIGWLEGALEDPIAHTEDALASLSRTDSELNDRLNLWMLSQGWEPSSQPEQRKQNLARASRLSYYILLTRLVFYQVMRRRFRQMPLLSLGSVSTPDQLREVLDARFDEAVRYSHDYETVFVPDENDLGYTIPFMPTTAPRDWARLFQRIEEFDFSSLDFDVIGQMYERLISASERRRFGQFYTSPDVVDLISAFCIRRPDDRVLDPACGGGTFLVRAYCRWSAKMSLVLLAMITDGSYSTRSRFMGGLRASMYFFAVSRWMPSSRATPRVDNPLRFAF